MTEEQRDYLADLAGRKGVKLSGTDDVSREWASAKIEELKAMPDAVFDEPTQSQLAKIRRLQDFTLTEMRRWNFTR